MEEKVYLYARTKQGTIFVCWLDPDCCLEDADHLIGWIDPEYLSLSTNTTSFYGWGQGRYYYHKKAS